LRGVATAEFEQNLLSSETTERNSAASIRLAHECDEPLIDRLRRGDPEAAREFYELYAARIHRFILHSLGPSEDADAEDILQDTFMALAEAIPFFRGQSSLFTFACAIAHRKTISFIRTKATRSQLLLNHSKVEEQTDAASQPDETIRHALASLTTEHREALLLKYVEDMAVAEIAAVLSLSEHAVESRLARARKALTKNLREIDHAEKLWNPKATK
jgi:RNA polymerase sigma-70 factor (ECF subfamily)